MPKKFLIRHLGNMGDMVFFVPPLLETLKRKYPDCETTLVTAWGYKTRKLKFFPPRWEDFWGEKNQGGFSIHLLITNPHIDQLIHFHETKTSLEGKICDEDGQKIPTWARQYYESQKESGAYTDVLELDFGLTYKDNPILEVFKKAGIANDYFSNYKIYLSQSDKDKAAEVAKHWPTPRIVLLEGLEGTSTRGWDPKKVQELEREIYKEYKVKPIWFGSKFIPKHDDQPLSLRENIATLTHCDVAIGVMSGPMHFAAAVGLPTITLYADQPLHRAAPAYFMNRYRGDSKKPHKTILGPSTKPLQFLKNNEPSSNLTPHEKAIQNSQNWQNPGKQSTKTGLAAITIAEVMEVLRKTL